MFDLEKFRTGKYYVHLPTQELYDEAMKFLDSHGFVWGGSRDRMSSRNYWNDEKEDTVIRENGSDSVVYSDEQYYKDIGYKKLELNKEENMNINVRGDLIKQLLNLEVNKEENMEEKIRRDFIKCMFEKKFKYNVNNNIKHYKGRLVSDYGTYTLDIIDFIDHLNKEYNIKGNEVAQVVIESFDVKEYEQ